VKGLARPRHYVRWWKWKLTERLKVIARRYRRG
jgi:hypothetical protein